MRRNVVITGIGVLSPIGQGRRAYWDALEGGMTGFGPITLFDTSPFPVTTAGEIAAFDAASFLGKKGLRDLDRSTRLVCSAARLALEDSGLIPSENNARSLGVAIGATFGSLHSIAQFDRSGLLEGPRFVNPSHFPNTVINSPASQVSIRLGIKGFNATLSTGFCAGLDAVSYATDSIRMGRTEAVLAGGVEELCEETFRLFHILGQLSGGNGSAPVGRPFDAGRDGFVLSEGSAVLVLEEEGHAAARGAAALAVVRGCGNAFDPDAEGTFAHAGEGLKRAIVAALGNARMSPTEIDCVCSGANGSPAMDRLEASVLAGVFGEHAGKLPVNAVKSMIGESFSASGALILAAAAAAVRRGFVPPTVNFRSADQECALDIVSSEPRRKRVKNVLVTAADPSGQNAAVIIGAEG